MSIAFSTLITRVNSIERGETEACGSKIMRLGIVMTSFVSCYSCANEESRERLLFQCHGVGRIWMLFARLCFRLMTLREKGGYKI